MASAFTDEACQTILKKGFWEVKDAEVGKRVDEIIRLGFRFKTNEGLDLCKATALDDLRIRNVIESFFARSVLGYYKLFGQTTGVHCVLNRTTLEMRILEVQLWSSGSRWVFYAGSHLHILNAVDAQNGLLEIPSDRLELPGITAAPMEMPNGGLALVDARLGFKVLKGKVIKLGFMIPEELPFWAKMPLPETLREKAKDMESRTIGMNFEFPSLNPQEVHSNEG